MKISTLVEIVEPALHKHRVQWPFKASRGTHIRLRNDVDIDKDEGSFSIVTKGDDSHSVIKKSKNPLNLKSVFKDAYWGYVYYIIKNKLSENPYFPRFYDVSRIIDKNGKMHFSAKMENLQSIDPGDKDLLNQLLNKIFDQHAVSLVGDWLTFLKVLRQIITTGESPFMKVIQDHYLVEALKSLHKFYKKYHAKDDINLHNLMIRRTPHGPQLVFTDPFSFFAKVNT